MANRIQLRRDTADNWTRVNPILDDGEPGLEIDTNKVKYGDGNTAWADLDYASGGLSLSYADFQEGVGGPPGNINVTSLTGYTGTGLSLTSDTWAQLMWVPDTTTVTIDDIDNGPVTYNWAYVDGNGFTVTNKVDGSEQYQWVFGLDGMFTLPQGSTISEVPAAETVTLDQLTDISSWTGTLVFTKNGQTYQALPNGPIMRYVGSNWLIQHDLTSWFSSTDLITWVAGPYAGTTAPVGTLSAATTNLTVDADTWTFSADGNLTFPTGGHIGPGGGKGEGTTLGGANDRFVSLTSYYDSGNYSSCVTANADGTLNITAYNDGGPNPAKVWTFDNDGNLTLPPSGDILIDGGTNSAIRDLVQHDVHSGNANYTLALSDRGKMIYQKGGYSVIVPTNAQVDFPVGTVITIVNSGGFGNLDITAYDNGANTAIYCSSTDSNSSSWGLPSNSIATILKVESSGNTAKWLLSGVGVVDNNG
jgi:hypothetical protein